MALPPSKQSNSGTQDPRAREEERRHDIRRQDQVANQCGEAEEGLEQLRTRYELFFVGVERREPAREREEMRRRVARLKAETGLNTGLRFRIDTVHARFLSYDRMWMRTAREKEDGTYRRDLQRLRRKEAARAAAEAPIPARAEKVPPRAPEPTVRAAETGGLSPEQLQALYAAYVEAKRRCNEDVSRITYDALAKTVAKQVPELIARYKAKSVEFKVLIKDGRALLKAIPRT